MPRPKGSKNKPKFTSEDRKKQMKDATEIRDKKRGRPARLQDAILGPIAYVSPDERKSVEAAQEHLQEAKDSPKKNRKLCKEMIRIQEINDENCVDIYETIHRLALETEDLDALTYLNDRLNPGPIRGRKFPYELPRMDSVEGVLDAQLRVMELLTEGRIHTCEAGMVLDFSHKILQTVREVREDRYQELKGKFDLVKGMFEKKFDIKLDLHS